VGAGGCTASKDREASATARCGLKDGPRLGARSAAARNCSNKAPGPSAFGTPARCFATSAPQAGRPAPVPPVGVELLGFPPIPAATPSDRDRLGPADSPGNRGIWPWRINSLGDALGDRSTTQRGGGMAPKPRRRPARPEGPGAGSAPNRAEPRQQKNPETQALLAAAPCFAELSQPQAPAGALSGVRRPSDRLGDPLSASIPGLVRGWIYYTHTFPFENHQQRARRPGHGLRRWPLRTA